jgi:ectoine hydroxylase
MPDTPYRYDVSEPGRGNLKVVPGSHLVNRIDGPPRRDIQWPDPEAPPR